jgi:ABC-type nitrate/sulfonate/bicarbonate transport system ATPase subunit
MTSLRSAITRPRPDGVVYGMRRSHARAAAYVSTSPLRRPSPRSTLPPCRGRRGVRAAAAPAAPPAADSDIAPPRGDTRGAALLVEDVLLSVGPEDLLLGASLRVEPGECIGLVGANGCGKSTLLRCVAGIRQPDGGNVLVNQNAAVGYLEQTAVSGSTRTVLEEAKSRMAATAAAAALAQAEAAAMSAELGQAAAAAAAVTAALDAFAVAGGPSAERRVASVLDGLGFSRSQWDTPCAQLSGGWQMRVALARLLLSPAGEGAAAPGAGDAPTAAGGGLLLLDECVGLRIALRPTGKSDVVF